MRRIAPLPVGVSVSGGQKGCATWTLAIPRTASQRPRLHRIVVQKVDSVQRSSYLVIYRDFTRLNVECGWRGKTKCRRLVTSVSAMLHSCGSLGCRPATVRLHTPSSRTWSPNSLESPDAARKKICRKICMDQHRVSSRYGKSWPSPTPHSVEDSDLDREVAQS
jgi:hypothetical protein